MPQVADPRETQQLLKGADRFLSRMLLKALHPGALAVGQAVAAGLRLRRHQAGAADDRVRRAARAGSRRHGSSPDLRRAVPPGRRHDRSRAQGKGRVRRRRDLPPVHAHGLERHLREVAQGPRSHHLARPGSHRSRTRTGVRDRRGDGDEGLPRIRARGIEALLRAGAERPGGVQEDRFRTVRRVARPGAPVHERRAGLPGVPQRGRGRTLGPREESSTRSSPWRRPRASRSSSDPADRDTETSR